MAFDKKAYDKVWYEKNKDKLRSRRRAASKAHYRNNKDKRKAQMKSAHKERKYGLSQQQIDAIFIAQGGVCAICGEKETKGRGWHTDHCHETKVVRGVLCHNCNVGLGHFRDDPSLLCKAAGYLCQTSK